MNAAFAALALLFLACRPDEPEPEAEVSLAPEPLSPDLICSADFGEIAGEPIDPRWGADRVDVYFEAERDEHSLELFNPPFSDVEGNGLFLASRCAGVDPDRSCRVWLTGTTDPLSFDYQGQHIALSAKSDEGDFIFLNQARWCRNKEDESGMMSFEALSVGFLNESLYLYLDAYPTNLMADDALPYPFQDPETPDPRKKFALTGELSMTVQRGTLNELDRDNMTKAGAVTGALRYF